MTANNVSKAATQEEIGDLAGEEVAQGVRALDDFNTAKTATQEVGDETGMVDVLPLDRFMAAAVNQGHQPGGGR
jgi:hypothetical protein